jgi:two-component system, chemotaxis family, CheB/CheR fusion protein
MSDAAAKNGQPDLADAGTDLDAEWRALLEYLRLARGFDFTGYKPASLARRIRKRMGMLGIDSYEAYREHIEVHQEEFRELFNTILINVTSFFRDPEAWDALREQAIGNVLATRPAGGPIRAWSAGCATGEEAYTIAILLAEALGTEQFRERVKIYATDIDEEALSAARQAVYAEKQLENVPPELRQRYFEQLDGMFSFQKDLRRQVVFGRHDLITDAPISRVDLLACRNTLMYFNAETQARILGRFHFALNDEGYLFLGRAETMMTRGQFFTPVDQKRRISRKRPSGYPRDSSEYRQILMAGAEEPEPQGPLLAAALEASPVAQLVVDADGRVVTINDLSRSLFGLHSTDVGRPLHDLQVSYRPADLRSLIERVGAERQPIAVKEVEWRSPAGELRWLDVHVAPLDGEAGGPLGTVVTFTDTTGYRRLQRELEQSHLELETAYEELQSTNEELETTNEELQSTVEELETTNEELQSTNEELETINEELQSTNEELEATNTEMRQRGDEVNQANAFLHSVLAGLRSGVAVVDRELRLLAWNSHAEELWGVRSQEVDGEHLLNLDIGLPVERLRPALKTCIGGESPSEQITLDAVNRRGRTIRCHVTCSPLRTVDGSPGGAILVMEEIGDGAG